MKLIDTFVFAALCGLLGAGGAVIQNYSLARSPVASAAPAAGDDDRNYAKARRDFLNDRYSTRSSDECAYMALYEHAQATKDVTEMTTLREAYLRHCARGKSTQRIGPTDQRRTF